MDYSQKISEKHWNLEDKAERECDREKFFIDDIIQKAHIEREILSNLKGIRNVFDGGAGTGRFSIMLAKRGLHVTHFDISKPMIDKAKELAMKAGVSGNITFIQGALEDLSMFSDREFDMVLSFDAPISYTYPDHEKVIADLVRITNKNILISVSSRLGTLPYIANPLQKIQFLQDKNNDDRSVRWWLDNAEENVKNFYFNKEYCEMVWKTGLSENVEDIVKSYNDENSPWPITYLFMPDELRNILKDNGVEDIRLAGPGAYARTIPNEILVKIMNDKKQKEDFLDFCYRYDSDPYVCGMGKDNLLACGNIYD
jgi:ubiquinone/menaquinone biosynthesis C-methylase UbiE